jgi:two-component system, NarL family, invasion response regulator UvrY
MIIEILIADDHAIMREGLKQILAACADMRVAGEASDGDEVLHKVRQQEWSVVVLDMSMPGRSGIDLIKLVKAEKPGLPILVLSMHTDEQYAARTLRAGASGYLCKDSAPSLLVSAIRKVASGGTFISPKAAESMALGALHKVGDAPPHALLSDREFQIFEMIIAGDNITEIANRLNISIKTVSTHKTRILQKLNLATVADMVHYAIEHGIAKQH